MWCVTVYKSIYEYTYAYTYCMFSVCLFITSCRRIHNNFQLHCLGTIIIIIFGSRTHKIHIASLSLYSQQPFQWESESESFRIMNTKRYTVKRVNWSVSMVSKHHNHRRHHQHHHATWVFMFFERYKFLSLVYF